MSKINVAIVGVGNCAASSPRTRRKRANRPPAPVDICAPPPHNPRYAAANELQAPYLFL